MTTLEFKIFWFLVSREMLFFRTLIFIILFISFLFIGNADIIHCMDGQNSNSRYSNINPNNNNNLPSEDENIIRIFNELRRMRHQENIAFTTSNVNSDIHNNQPSTQTTIINDAGSQTLLGNPGTVPPGKALFLTTTTFLYLCGGVVLGTGLIYGGVFVIEKTIKNVPKVIHYLGSLYDSFKKE